MTKPRHDKKTRKTKLFGVIFSYLRISFFVFYFEAKTV